MTVSNVLDLARSRVEMKKESSSSWCGPCPGCGGRDRFIVKPAQNDGQGSYWCRGCERGGDRIQFLMDFDGMDFKEACAALGIEKDPLPRRIHPHKPKDNAEPKFQPREYGTPQELWRSRFGELVEFCHCALLNNPEQLAYLAGRGIHLEAVKRFKLGWNPGKDGRDLYRARAAWGAPEDFKDDGTPKKLWIPRGIVIPCFVDGTLVRVRIRRQAGDSYGKYIFMPGSSSAAMLINPEAKAFVVVEAELDAMALAAQVPDQRVGYLGVQTNLGKPDATAWPRLQSSLRILVALDFDKPDSQGRRPGYQGWLWWKRQFPDQAKRWLVPEGKDPGEAYGAGVDLVTWVRAGLPPRLTIGPLSSALWKGGTGVEEKKVEVDPLNGLSRQKKSSAEAPAEFIRMAKLLKDVPLGIQIGGGCRIVMDEAWPNKNKENWERFSAVSQAFFKCSEALFSYLEAHPRGVVTGENFWDLWESVSSN